MIDVELFNACQIWADKGARCMEVTINKYKNESNDSIWLY